MWLVRATLSARRRLAAVGSRLDLKTGRDVAAFFAVYGLVHAGATLLGGPALALDDDKLSVLTQSLEPGYLPDNPPLFEWLLIIAQQLFGPGRASFLAVKYGLLTVLGVATFAAARAVGAGDRGAAIAPLGLLLIVQIGWGAHQSLTHTVALLAACALFWWALAALLRRASLGGYVLLGAALGIGFLSKYSFPAVACVALLAAARRRDARRLLFDPRGLATISVAILIASPHALWLVRDNVDIAHAAVDRFRGDAAPYWTRLAAGAPQAAWVIISFFILLTPIAALSFGSRVVRLGPSSVAQSALIARDAALGGAAALVFFVIALGVDDLHERYGLPFLYPALIWLAARAEQPPSRAFSRARQCFAGAALCVAFVALAVRLAAALAPGPPFCTACRQWTPYAALAEEVRAVGGAEATLVGFEDRTAGNLRRLLPDARVLSAHIPTYAPPILRPGDACLFIWSPDLGPNPPDVILDGLDLAEARSISAPWRHWRTSISTRTTRWTIAPVARGASRTRALCRLDASAVRPRAQ